MKQSYTRENAMWMVRTMNEHVNGRLKAGIQQYLADAISSVYTNKSTFEEGLLSTSIPPIVIPNEDGTRFLVDVQEAMRANFHWPEWALNQPRKNNREDVYKAIDAERAYQIEKFGDDKQQSLPGFLVIIKNELDEAMLGWAKDLPGRNSPLAEICQIAATCVAAMEKYGTTGNAVSTDDKRPM